jgi:hypothetical protein
VNAGQVHTPAAIFTTRTFARHCIRDSTRSYSKYRKDLFSYQGPEGDFSISGDGIKIKCIFENLFANSIQAGATRIQVRLSVGKHVIVTTVEDDGVGCDLSTTESLFNAFFTTKKDQHGTGLGLSIVRNIVENLGGSISAYSKNLLADGKSGMIFTIALPIPGAQNWDEKHFPALLMLDEELNGSKARIFQILQNAQLRFQAIQEKDIMPINLLRGTKAICSEKLAGSLKSYQLFILKPIASQIALAGTKASESVLFTEESALTLES